MVLCKCLKKIILTSLYHWIKKIILTSLYHWPGGIGTLPGGLTNCCPSVLNTVGWVF